MSPFFVNPPTIVSERLMLRPLQRDDATAVFEYASRPEVTKNVLFETHLTIKDSEEFISKILDQSELTFGLVWAVVLNETNRLIGTIGIHNINMPHQRLEVGYALHDEFWNRGIITEALRLLIDAIFSHTDINRIEALCVSDHRRSYRVMEKNGMKYEGTLRQANKMKDGVHDMRVYSILRNEYCDTPIIIKEYDPNWIEAFKGEERILTPLLSTAARIEHIGSTSVKGLAAKPTIDIMIGVESLTEAEQYVVNFTTVGYEYLPMLEKELPERRYFRKRNASFEHTHHIHLVEIDSSFWKNHLYFRDRLRSDAGLREGYQVLKGDLAERFKNDREAYANAKTDFILRALNEPLNKRSRK